MIRLLARHEVRDFATFKAGYQSPEMTAVRTNNGVKADAVFQLLDNPNDVLVIHDFETAAAAEAFLAKPDLKEAMTMLGVVGEPKIALFQQA